MTEYKGYLIPETKNDIMAARIPGTQLTGIICRDVNDPNHYLTLLYDAKEILTDSFDMSQAIQECKDMIDEQEQWTATIDSFDDEINGNNHG